jgi:hypothetical protein
MQNTVHLPLSRRDTAYMGGTVASRRGIGGGTLLLGVKRQCSAVSSLEASASVGLRGAASLAAQRQLSEHASGGLTLTWSPRDGTSLLVSLERQLSEHCRGHWGWTLGPGGGIATGVSRAAGPWAATSELRVGAGVVRTRTHTLLLLPHIPL